MEILIVVLIATVVFGLCFRFAPAVDKAKRAKEMREYMHDHEKVVGERLGIGGESEEAGHETAPPVRDRG
jgi:Sec-independent protein translocase protein TatA